ncbi:Hypothetical predicted protein [Olea europaea subsp. europaea]|uniref:Uncharacterized protein n=1 Tax=Olea europaea subsp. europaea TaxID=158383 RepID=A0A8S0PVJ0_OLEEU|nr:Hypothetical predicted protein [Olea europaea subsp. europaea]
MVAKSINFGKSHWYSPVYTLGYTVSSSLSLGSRVPQTVTRPHRPSHMGQLWDPRPKELATVTANMRTISQQNTTMQELLKHMQGQLANSLQNEEVVPHERNKDVDTVADYATDQMIGETVVPLKYSRAIVPKRLASVFDRFGPTRNRQSRPRISPAQLRLPHIPLSQHTCSTRNQHGQLQSRTTVVLTHRCIHSQPKNRREKRAALAQMRANQN